MPPAEAPTIATLSKEIQSRLELARDLLSRLSRPNLPAARESATVFWQCFHTLSKHTDLGSATAGAISSEALYRSFDAFLAFRAGEFALATSVLLRTWISLVPTYPAGRVHPETLTFASFLQSAPRLEASEPIMNLYANSRIPIEFHDRTALLLLYNQAVEQIVTSELGSDQARTALRSLTTRLKLSQGDTGVMFGVSGETIRRWERGATGVPADRRPAILAAESALRRLQDLFRPERLPTVIRRKAELFDGESALAWILRGRIRDVADRYEGALLYQA